MVKVAKPLRISTEFSRELAWGFHPLPTLPSARLFARSDGLLEGSLKTGSAGNTPQRKEHCLRWIFAPRCETQTSVLLPVVCSVSWSRRRRNYTGRIFAGVWGSNLVQGSARKGFDVSCSTPLPKSPDQIAQPHSRSGLAHALGYLSRHRRL